MSDKLPSNQSPAIPSTSTPNVALPLHAAFDVNLLEPYLPQVNPPRSSSPSQGAHPLLPHVTLTYAQSLDSQISLSPGVQTILSGQETKAMTHYLRTRHDAILVGAGTANADNPGLNSRYADEKGLVGLERQPRPVVLDAHGLWRPRGDGKVFELARKGEGKAPWWITGGSYLVGNQPPGYDETVRLVREESGGQVLQAGGDKDWREILELLAAQGIRSVMIEGGGSIINNLLEARNQQYVNSVIVTIAPTYLGAGGVSISPNRTNDGNEVRVTEVKWIAMGQDIVMAGRLENT